MIIDEDDYLEHYGTPRKSGRYPWGSGVETPPRNMSFLDTVAHLRKQGVSDTDIARGMGISTTQFRARNTIERNAKKQAQIAEAQRLHDKGMGSTAAARQMGIPEPTYRTLLAPGAADRAKVLTATSDMLKRRIDDDDRLLDVGVGSELYMNVAQSKLNASVAILKEQGYVVHSVNVAQLGTGHDTKVKVLCPPGTSWGDAQRLANQGKVKSVIEFSEDGGRTYDRFEPPIAINPKRVQVNWAKQNAKGEEIGGGAADGVIYVRPGVKDISLGGKNYAQVRVQVGDSHYLKGMAIYKKDMPDGVDLIFNSNKDDTGNKFDAMKPLKRNDDGSINADLPFGSVVRQLKEVGPDGKKRVYSAMNRVNEEGSWDEWSRNLSSQFLSKQSPQLAKQQLDITYNRRKNELDEIKALTNVTVKKKLLESYAESTDSAAVHMKAAKFPGQATQVILPMNKMKPTEVYAPNFNNGDSVVLVRYPHGGTFEIPRLTVNNKQRDARDLLGDAKDAIGIHHSVAKQLSGADFDGDTVLVIPDNRGRIKNSSPLDKLKDFDPQREYAGYDGMRRMKKSETQLEMGKISNLITDMTIRGASHEHIARAVRHSMVVIDAEKKGLDYKRSYMDHNIGQLKAEYQGSSRAGASTLISQAGAKVKVPQMKPRPMKEGGPIDRTTGAKVMVPTGKKHADGSPKMEKRERLSLTDDAFTLVSQGGGTPVERHYAKYSNDMKALANEARLISVNLPTMKSNASAKATFKDQVQSLNDKLALAERNAPRERQALVIANAAYKAKLQANPDLGDDAKRKIKFEELETARNRMGAGKEKFDLTQDEWNAIQAGAITDNKLQRILTHADIDQVRAFATPRRSSVMTSNMVARARGLFDTGYTRAEVAERLGVSVTTLNAAMDDE